MNKKKLALEVFNSSEMKKIASLKSVDKAAMIRMIAEEVMQEAETPQLKSVKGALRRATNPKIAPDQLEKNIQKIKSDLDQGVITHNAFESLSDEEKALAFQYIEKRIQYTVKASELVAQDPNNQEVAAAEEQDPIPEPEQDEIEGTEGGPGVMIDGGTSGEEVDIEPAFDRFGQILYPDIISDQEDLAVVLKFLAFSMSKGLIKERFIKLAQALKYDQKTLEEFNLTLSPEESERLKRVLDDPEMLKAITAAISQPSDSEQPTTVEIKPLLDRFATFIQRTGVLNEKINYVIQALDLKDTKVFGKSLAQNFNREEIETLKSHFEDTNNGALFFKQYFSQDPEFLERFNQALAGEEQEPSADGTLDGVMDIPEGEIQNLKEAYDKWSAGFMTTELLLEQSQIFAGLWNSIKIFAGKAKSDLEQAERAINFKTASKEEEEEARKELQKEAPEDDLFSDELPSAEDDAAMDRAMADEREYQAQQDELEAQQDPRANTVGNTIGSALDGIKGLSQKFAVKWKKETGQEPPPPQEVKKFQRNVLERLLVLKRHSNQIEDVLGIYQQYTGKLTVGSVDALKKYGDSNPRRLLYKLVNLLMKDINSLLGIINDMLPKESKTNEALMEVEGEKFSDKLRKVEAVNKFVLGEGQVLLRILGAGQVEKEPELQREQEEEAPTEQPPAEQKQDQNKALASQEQALKIYTEMAKIKTYFPTASPLDTDYQLDKVIEDFGYLVKVIQDHVSTMARFKADEDINPSSLESAKEGLLTIKKVLVELFGVTDEGVPQAAAEDEAAYTEAGQEAIENDQLKEPTVVEVEYDEEGEEEEEELVAGDEEPPEEGKLQTLTNRSAIERHMKNYFLSPQMFMEVFEDNEKLNPPEGPSPMDAAYDAFTLFWILTKFKKDQAPEELSEASAEVVDAAMADRDAARSRVGMGDDSNEPFMATSQTKVAMINRKLGTSKLFTDSDMVENIVYNVLNKYFKQKSKDLSFFFDSVDGGELRKLQRVLRIQEDKYPFEVVMPNMGTFIKEYGGEDAFADKEEPAADETEPSSNEDELEAEDIEGINNWLDSELDEPEVQEKIAALPETGPELVDGLEELTSDMMAKDNWDSIVQQIDLSLPNINLEPESPELKQTVADAVKDEVGEKRPEIDLSGVDLSTADPLEPDMDTPASIDMPESPRTIKKQAFNREIRKLKNKAKGRFDVGKAKNVLVSILKSRKVSLDEGQFAGREVTTIQDLMQALVEGGAFEGDENSMHNTMLVVDMMNKLGVEFKESPAPTADDSASSTPEDDQERDKASRPQLETLMSDSLFFISEDGDLLDMSNQQKAQKLKEIIDDWIAVLQKKRPTAPEKDVSTPAYPDQIANKRYKKDEIEIFEVAITPTKLLRRLSKKDFDELWDSRDYRVAFMSGGDKSKMNPFRSWVDSYYEDTKDVERLEEQLNLKLIPVIREMLNRTKNG